jgi:hypothetical protein
VRKTKTITIPDKPAFARDIGKVFVICEMDAWQAEEWAERALEALADKTEIPASIREAGMLGIYIIGFRAIASSPWALKKPLLDEMFATCLSFQPDPNNPKVLRGAGTLRALGAEGGGVAPAGALVPSDTEEVATRLFLRDQIMELHVGFSVAAGLSQIWENLQTLAAAFSPDTQTSQGLSDQSSQQGSPPLPN